MIFVTVGTHEQPFDRLVKAIDRLKEEKIIEQEVFVQNGYSPYKPGFCQYRDFIPFEEMMSRMEEAEIVITHGGTGSIMLVLYHGKVPLVMPRQSKYDEHIDDHQVLFCKTMEAKGKIIAVYEADDLESVIKNYPQLVQQLQNQGNGQAAASTEHLNEKARVFADKLHEICLQLVTKK